MFAHSSGSKNFKKISSDYETSVTAKLGLAKQHHSSLNTIDDVDTESRDSLLHQTGAFGENNYDVDIRRIHDPTYTDLDSSGSDTSVDAGKSYSSRKKLTEDTNFSYFLKQVSAYKKK